jgi:hypothetical protein
VLSLTQNGLEATFWATFFTSSSGHPDCQDDLLTKLVFVPLQESARRGPEISRPDQRRAPVHETRTMFGSESADAFRQVPIIDYQGTFI